MKWLDRAEAAWDARFRQRVTRFGMAYGVATALVGIAAFVSANNLLFLILAAMFATLMISGFVGRMSLAGLELDLLLPPHVSARSKVRAVVRLKNLKRWVPSFSVQLTFSREPAGRAQSALYFLFVAGGGSLEEPVELYFPMRGAHTERSFQFSTRFPFGFVQRREDVTIRHEVIVYPCLEPRQGFEALLASVSEGLSARERGQGTDFYRIRPYDSNDSARSVDWKATAHTGELQVREFVREENRTVVIYLDLDVPAGSEAWFESAVECAAFLLFELSARQARIHFLTQTWDAADADIYTILKYLALVSPQQGRPETVQNHHDLHVVLTQYPERFRALGWCDPRSPHGWLVGPDFF
ncbi:MAG: hypothetical protein RL328_597 [Acidobacteriota bacterium]|jgi:uncharacterized protein (DUF58 family)